MRRPNSSEKEDHHSGKMAMESMYSATDRFTIVEVVLNSRVRPWSAAALC